MRNFQGIVFIQTHTYREIFKSALAYFNETRKLQILIESPEYQAATSEIPFFPPKYVELQNTIHQEVPPYSIGKLASLSLFD